MANETTPPVKPGWQSSEFWLTALATLIGLAYTAGIIHVDGSTALDRVLAFAASTLAAIGYQVNRTLLKSKAL